MSISSALQRLFVFGTSYRQATEFLLRREPRLRPHEWVFLGSAHKLQGLSRNPPNLHRVLVLPLAKEQRPDDYLRLVDAALMNPSIRLEHL